MAELVLTDAVLWLGKYALQGSLNSIAMSMSVDMVDVTAFGDTTHNRLSGLYGSGIQMEGHWDVTPSDEALFTAIGSTYVPITVAPTSTVSSTAFVMKALQADYTPGAKVGDAFAFSAGAQSDGRIARGVIFSNTSLSATASSTGQQLGALSATQKLLCCLHATAVSGTSPTLDVTVESDDNSGFTSATTRGTFSQLTAAGSAFLEISGAVTDTYWRFKYTIGGTGPSWTIAAAAGRF